MTNLGASSSSKWTVGTINSVGSPCESNSLETWTIKHADAGQERRIFVHVPPSICSEENDDNDTKYPILLAFHGYGGGPRHEIQKWKSTCDDRKYILVAPQGSTNKNVDTQLAWNAIDCCGYPASQNTDDVDFVIGVMKTLDTVPHADTSNVVATGFSNGGFFVSLLGLLQRGKRPEWLKAIVPTGGYQYDTSLYNDGVDPLPMFAHHGESDSVVRPEGCCRDPSKGDRKSNCPANIGSLRDTCLPVEQAFNLWATNINACDNTQKYNTGEGVTCWIGTRCRATTKLCMWPNAGHSWGGEMPGVDMVGEFLEELKMMDSKSKVQGIVTHMDSSRSSTLSLLLLVVGALAVVALFALTRVPHKRDQHNCNAPEQEEVLELVDSSVMSARTSRVAVTRFV